MYMMDHHTKTARSSTATVWQLLPDDAEAMFVKVVVKGAMELESASSGLEAAKFPPS